MDTPNTMSPAEAAERLGIKESTLRRYVQQKRIPHVRVGKRIIRFTEANIADYLAMQTVPANSLRLTERSLTARRRKSA